VYLYFCVTDGTLYYRNQAIFLQNEIQIEIRPNVYVYLSGLVLLEGSPGERKKLVSSITNELLDFDQTKMRQRCSAPTWVMLKEFHKIHEEHQQNTNLLRIIENSSANCVKSITNSSSVS
jgi:hypothetical protein